MVGIGDVFRITFGSLKGQYWELAIYLRDIVMGKQITKPTPIQATHNSCESRFEHIGEGCYLTFSVPSKVDVDWLWKLFGGSKMFWVAGRFYYLRKELCGTEF